MVVDEVFSLACEKLSLCCCKPTSFYFLPIVAGDGHGLSCVGGGAVVGCWQGCNSWWLIHVKIREGSVYITQMYIFLFFVLGLALQFSPLLLIFIYASFSPVPPHGHFVLSESFTKSSDPLSSR